MNSYWFALENLVYNCWRRQQRKANGSVSLISSPVVIKHFPNNMLKTIILEKFNSCLSNVIMQKISFSLKYRKTRRFVASPARALSSQTAGSYPGCSIHDLVNTMQGWLCLSQWWTTGSGHKWNEIYIFTKLLTPASSHVVDCSLR